MYTKEKINDILSASLDELFEKDSQIIFKTYNLHERSITHRLALYLENHFKGSAYVVDVEYNRMRNKYDEDIIGNEIGKRLDFEKYGKDPSSVYPDIIVHQRDTNNNLLEIEVKMKWKNSKREFDLIKINEYISQLGYQFGVYIEIDETRENSFIQFGPFDIWNKCIENALLLGRILGDFYLQKNISQQSKCRSPARETMMIAETNTI